MSESIMELCLENLDSIHQTLKIMQKSYLDELSAFNFNENVTTSSENRDAINLLFDTTGKYLYEVSPIDSFLQYCDLNILTLTPEQLKSIMVCQQLCKDIKDSSHKALKWIAKSKERLNDSGCIAPDENITDSQPNRLSAAYQEDMISVPNAMLQARQAYSDILQEFQKDLLFVDSAMMHVAGKRLGVVDGYKMFIETEHEMCVFLDYALLEYRKDGKNIVERYYNLNHKLYSGKKLEALLALKNAQFSFLQIIKPIHENGVVVKDLLTGETLLMINSSLYDLAKSSSDYAVLTHYIKAPGFIMIASAATPVSLSSPTGKNMWQIFERLISHSHNKVNLTTAQYYQCITDLFKIVIHDGITRKIASPMIPIDYHTMRGNARNH